MQISKLNKHAEGVAWPNVTTHTWKSDDGLPVEGLLLHAAASKSTAPAPLIVFTHCGPAMASLGNNSRLSLCHQRYVSVELALAPCRVLGL